MNQVPEVYQVSLPMVKLVRVVHQANLVELENQGSTDLMDSQVKMVNQVHVVNLDVKVQPVRKVKLVILVPKVIPEIVANLVKGDHRVQLANQVPMVLTEWTVLTD